MSSITVNNKLSHYTHFKVKGVMIFLGFLSFLFFANSANAGLILNHPNYTGLNNGLVGWWSFDGKDMAGNTAYDRSGQGNNGTLSSDGTGLPVRVGGKLGQGLSFDGVDDQVVLPTSAVLSMTSSVTVSAWIRRQGNAATYARIFEHGMVSGAPNLEYSLIIDNTDKLAFGLTTGGVADETPSNATLPQNVWIHVVGTWDGTNKRLYINGSLDRTIAQSGTITEQNNTNTLGYRIGPMHNFNGLIDDVRIYNRALSADEIKRLYRIGGTLKLGSSQAQNTGSLTQGLVGYWSFDESTHGTTSVADLSGNNNRGHLINGPQKAIGKIGQGLSFDGVDDYVFVSSSHILTSNNWTAAGWCKVSGAGGDGHNILFESGDDLGATVSGISLRCYRQSAPIGNASILAVVGANSEEVVNSTSPLPLNTWIHVTGVKEGTSLLLYINGALNNSATLSSAIMDYTGDIVETVISTDNSRTGTVKGALDDVRVYNRALSADEIKRLYNLGR